MKKTKKLLALLLVVVMLASTLSVSVNAIDWGGHTPYVPVDEDVLPTIIVPGLFQSETKYYEDGKVALDADGNEYKMPFFMDTTTEIVGDALTQALVPIAELLINQEDKDQMAANAVADVLCETLLGKQKLDETGHFVNDIRATQYNASFDQLSEYDQNTVLEHFPMEYYIEHAGADKLYIFSYASLDNMIDIANRLYNYIQFVKEDSGYDKVNIVPISQGGSVANALMEIYNEKGRSLAEDINKMVFAVPALDGSTLVGEILEFGLIDEDNELYCKMLPALLGEDDMISYAVNIVLRIMPNADLHTILDVVFGKFISEYAGYSTALWGLCPTANYPGAREKYLMAEGMEQIREQTDWFYNAQLNSDANILKAIEDGVQVFDLVDYNTPLVHIVDSWDIPADGIIQVDSTSMGAYAVGNGVKLPADYVSEYSNCTDPENHNHKDPNNLIDPCTGLLPETTFYFLNQSHESSASNDVFMKLASAILMDSNFTSVHSYPDVFPQFNNARKVKGLAKDVDEYRNFDTSILNAEDTVELAEAIAQVEAMLDNTIINTYEVEAAKVRFYAIKDRVDWVAENNGDYDAPHPEKENTAYFDFSYLLKDILKILSDLLFKYFGGAGFSEILGK